MDHKPLHSNHLRSAGYDAREQILEIAFSNGSLRCYQNVPLTVFKSLLAAPNPATFHEDRIEEEYAWQPGQKPVTESARQRLDDLFGSPSDDPSDP